MRAFRRRRRRAFTPPSLHCGGLFAAAMGRRDVAVHRTQDCSFSSRQKSRRDSGEVASAAPSCAPPLSPPLAAQAGGSKFGLGFVKIQEYGSAFAKTKSGAARKPVKLLYNGNNQCVTRKPPGRGLFCVARASLPDARTCWRCVCAQRGRAVVSGEPCR